MKLLLLCLIVTAVFTGCSSVSPWEKGLLGDPAVQFSSEQKGAVYEQHMLNSREASSGGYGGAGGGCGCK
jgi:uncharacterized protein YceK